MFARSKTVDAAIAPLLKAQTDLSAVVNERSKTIERNHYQITELQADNVAADAERTRAEKIGNALLAITDPKD